VTTLRRVSILALLVAFAQVVFGAVVRITGSGMGCGDHWPDCYGSLTPAHGGPNLLVEISHRYGAAALTVVILILAATAIRTRGQPGVGGSRGALRSALSALALVVVAALFGAATVKLQLNPFIVVTHLAIAMSLLAVLVVTAVRSGAFGADRAVGVSARTSRAARAAVGLTFVTLIFGALTANTPGAPLSCQGFPLCRNVAATGEPLWIQIIHRVFAFLILGHLIGVAIGVRKRAEARPVRTAAWISLAVVVFQIFVGAAMVEMHLPAGFRSLHQTVGTLLWVCVVIIAALASARRETAPLREIVRESPSRGEFATPEGVST
jgi:heme A synthase